MPRPDFDLLDMPPDPPSSGEPVVVFYDCEFTDLTSNSELLSIGFVVSDLAAELYIEIADANLETASEFVRKEVLPLFGKFNPEILTRSNAAKRIAGWLDELRQGERCRQIVVVSDSTWDWEHLDRLFGGVSGQTSWALRLNAVGRTVEQLVDLSLDMTGFSELIENYHREHNFRHHALVDARALKSAYRSR